MGWLDDRIKATEKAIEEAEQAEADIMAGTAQSYTLDTGQTRQSVTKLNIGSLRQYIDTLYNRRATLLARRDGSGSRTARPDW